MKATLVYTNDFGFVVFSKINLISMNRITNGNPNEYMFSDSMKILFKPIGKRKVYSKTFRFRTPSSSTIFDEYILLKGWIENPIEQYNGSVTCFSQNIFDIISKTNLSKLQISDSTSKIIINDSLLKGKL